MQSVIFLFFVKVILGHWANQAKTKLNQTKSYEKINSTEQVKTRPLISFKKGKTLLRDSFTDFLFDIEDLPEYNFTELVLEDPMDYRKV